MNFEVRPIDKATARDLIVANHYSHSWNSAFGTYCFGVFDTDGLAGALVYGNPMNPESFASVSSLPSDALTELNRMWIDDRLGKNTETAALSRTFKWLRSNSSVRLVQTFADGRLGVGTVYKAANFIYCGSSETLFFRDRDTGAVYHGVPFQDTRRTGGFLPRNHMLATGRLGAFLVKTYRYLYPLDRRARRAIRLTTEPYPRYERGETDLPGYVPPATQMARCLIMADALGYEQMAVDFDAFLATNYAPGEVADALSVARMNNLVAAKVSDSITQPALDFGEPA